MITLLPKVNWCIADSPVKRESVVARWPFNSKSGIPCCTLKKMLLKHHPYKFVSYCPKRKCARNRLNLLFYSFECTAMCTCWVCLVSHQVYHRPATAVMKLRHIHSYANEQGVAGMHGWKNVKALKNSTRKFYFRHEGPSQTCQNLGLKYLFMSICYQCPMLVITFESI